MPEWADTGIVLSVKRYGENDAVVSFLTSAHGRHSGLCKGAFCKRQAGTFQQGNLVKLRWKARLEEHLGTVFAELAEAYAVRVMNDSHRLTALSCLCAMSDLLPEREDLSGFFEKTLEQIVLLPFDGFEERYVRWELDLLALSGFGLDLTHCALSGTTENLAYVSPKSGRAVNAAAAEPWKDRLLPLPAFLTVPAMAPKNLQEMKDAFSLTGFFLENYLSKTLDCRIPSVRARFVAAVCNGGEGDKI